MSEQNGIFLLTLEGRHEGKQGYPRSNKLMSKSGAALLEPPSELQVSLLQAEDRQGSYAMLWSTNGEYSIACT